MGASSVSCWQFWQSKDVGGVDFGTALDGECGLPSTTRGTTVNSTSEKRRLQPKPAVCIFIIVRNALVSQARPFPSRPQRRSLSVCRILKAIGAAGRKGRHTESDRRCGTERVWLAKLVMPTAIYTVSNTSY